MSEHKYQFGDPIDVFMHDSWRPGVYIVSNRTNGNIRVAYQHPTFHNGAETDWVEPDKVRPRVIAPIRTGWRLPEPGDVIRVADVESSWWGREVRVNRFDPQDSYPVKCFDGEGNNGFAFYQVELVRLHDAPPAEAAKPEEPKPFGVSPEARRRCLYYLSLLNTLQSHRVIPKDPGKGASLSEIADRAIYDLEEAALFYLREVLEGRAK